MNIRKFAGAAAALCVSALTSHVIQAQSISLSTQQSAQPQVVMAASTGGKLLSKVVAASPKLAGYAACVIPQAAIGLTPSAMSFGNVPSGSSSSPQLLTISSTGNKELVISSIFVDRGFLDSASTFQVGGSCTNILPGSSCSVPVIFNAQHPTALSVPGTLKVFSNAPGSPHSIGLSAAVTVGPPPPAPGVSILPSAGGDFGNVLVGGSQTRTYTVNNTGNANLVISGVQVNSGGDTFSVVPSGSPTCLGAPTTVAAGQSCQFGIQMSPTSSGSKNSSMLLLHNAAPTATNTSIFVTGNAVPTVPTLEIQPSALEWFLVEGDHEDQQLTVKNISAVPASISEVNVSGSGFSLRNEDCTTNSPLAAGTTCTVEIRAQFNFSDGYSGLVSISNNTATNPISASLYASVSPKPAEFSLSPGSLDFGTYTVGVSSPMIMDVTVTNTSDSDTLTFSGAMSYGYNFFVHAPTSGTPCGSGVLPGQSCTIGVLFQAFSEFFFDDYLTVTDSNYGKTQTIYVSGNGFIPGPRIGSDVSVYSYGSQVVGSTSLQTFTITNTGQATYYPVLEFYDIYMNGDPAFKIANTSCPITINQGSDADPNPLAKARTGAAVNSNVLTLAPNQTCQVTVEFTPTAEANVYSILSFYTNALNLSDSDFTIFLDGTGTAAPQASVDYVPMSLSFTAQPLCSTSTGKAVSFANTGAAPLNISSVVSSGEFVSTSDCPAVLAPGSCCTIGVTYAPQVTGSGTGTLTITHDGPGGPTVIPLTGATDGAKVCVNPASMTFPDTRDGTSSPTQVLAISNPSPSAAVTISSVATSADFKAAQPTGPTTVATAPNCVGILAPSAVCNVQVGFQPTSGPGSKSGSVMITTNIGTPKAVPVAGVATPATAPGISLSTGSLEFGAQIIATESGAQTLSVTSGGTQALNITSVSVTGPFRLVNNCPDAVPVGVTCTISVFFRPAALGQATGSLTIASNSAGSPNAIRLAGQGIPVPAPILALSATSLSFGTQLTGTTGQSQSVVVFNRGNAPLLITSVESSQGFTLGNGCPASLAAGSNCSLTITFQAFGVGTQTGTLTIRSNDSGSPHGVLLNGKSCPPFSLRGSRLGLSAC